jgi:hypothetical protein
MQIKDYGVWYHDGLVSKFAVTKTTKWADLPTMYGIIYYNSELLVSYQKSIDYHNKIKLMTYVRSGVIRLVVNSTDSVIGATMRFILCNKTDLEDYYGLKIPWYNAFINHYR